jgi:hypothetical protein
MRLTIYVLKLFGVVLLDKVALGFMILLQVREQLAKALYQRPPLRITMFSSPFWTEAVPAGDEGRILQRSASRYGMECDHRVVGAC